MVGSRIQNQLSKSTSKTSSPSLSGACCCPFGRQETVGLRGCSGTGATAHVRRRTGRGQAGGCGREALAFAPQLAKGHVVRTMRQPTMM